MDELLSLARERPTTEADLIRALGRNANIAVPVPEPLQLEEESLSLESLRATALAQRPQLLALQSIVSREEKALDLARKNYYPDFDVRLAYGQRDKMLDGTRQPDMVTLTVAVNLPVWRENKLEPRVAEALAKRDQARSLYEAQRNEVTASLRQQIAMAEQNLKSARLYQTAILPQARLTVESALAAYRVNRVDFLTLLDSQMTVFNYEIGLATAIAGYNKALAEIDLLIGKPVYCRVANTGGASMKSIAKLIAIIVLAVAALAAGYWWGSAQPVTPAPNLPETPVPEGRTRGKQRQNPLLPQPDGASRHVARAQERFDGHGLSPRLRGRRVSI